MFCAVDDCMRNLTGSRRRSFKFPLDPELRRQWTRFCRRVDDINYQVERVCLQHFEMEDFERDSRFDGNRAPLKLRPEAVPSQHAHKDNQMLEEHSELPVAKEETLLADYEDEPAKDHPEEMDSDYDFEELPAEECLQVQVVDADAYLKVLEKENTELKRDNLKMNMSIQTSERDVERLQRLLDISKERYGQLVASLERVFSTAQIDKLQNDRRIVWPRADLIDAQLLYAASRSVYNMLLRRNYPLPSVRAVQYWEARERTPATCGSMQTARNKASAAPEQPKPHLCEALDATSTDHNYT